MVKLIYKKTFLRYNNHIEPTLWMKSHCMVTFKFLMYSNVETYPMNINQNYYVYKWIRVNKIRHKLPFNRLEIQKWASHGFWNATPFRVKYNFRHLTRGSLLWVVVVDSLQGTKFHIWSSKCTRFNVCMLVLVMNIEVRLITWR